MKSIIKKINIIVLLILLVGLLFSNYSHATSIENILKDAEIFLTKRK